MNRELLDDELYVEQADEYYFNRIKKQAPTLKGVAIVLVVAAFVKGIEILYYTLLYGLQIMSNLSLVVEMVASLVMIGVGYRFWQYFKAYQATEKQGLEENQAIWGPRTLVIWQLLGVVAIMNTVSWLINIVS